MINLDLALAPAMAAFGRPITITPVVSQPSAPAYAARGVWSFKAIEIPTGDGQYHSTNQPALGVRLADFTVPPKKGDAAVVDGVNYDLTDVIPDGQGGADLILRR